MSERNDVLAGRYRVAAPLPPIGGVPRDLAVDTVADGQVEVARFARRGPVPSGFAELAERYRGVRHPCLAPIVGWTEPGEDPGMDPLVVEQHIDGGRLGAGVSLPRRTALLVASDVADAIAALHAGRLMHGAITLEAIVIDAAGRAIVGGAGSTALQAAALGGATPDAAPADDLRALGRILYQLVCGRQPAKTPVAPAEIVHDVEPALNGLILSLLSDDPLRPPPPAAAVAMRLRDLAGEPVIDAAGTIVVAARRPLQTLRRAPARTANDFSLVLGATVLALLGIVVAFAATHEDSKGAGTTRVVTSLQTVTETAAGQSGPPIVSTEQVTLTLTETGQGFTFTQPGTDRTVFTYPGTTIITQALVTTNVTSTGSRTITAPLTVTVPAR